MIQFAESQKVFEAASRLSFRDQRYLIHIKQQQNFRTQHSFVRLCGKSCKAKTNNISCKSTKTMILEYIDLYAEQWSKREQVYRKYLSEWENRIKESVVERISGLKDKIRSPKPKILNDPNVKDTPSRLHADFVLASTD